MWEKKRSRFKRPEQDFYSISNKLKSEGLIDERFEIMLSTLTLEEIIGLRLELAAKSVNYKLYGLDLWNSMQYIVLDGTQGEMASFLGINKSMLKRLLKKYNITNYFSKS